MNVITVVVLLFSLLGAVDAECFGAGAGHRRVADARVGQFLRSVWG